MLGTNVDLAPTAPKTIQTALTELLTRGVRIAVGDETADPRPGQLALTLDIWQALEQKAGMCGIAPTGTGKALDVNTRVPTPQGWTTMGELVEGDELFDEHGNICRVTEAFAYMDNRECYELTFSDGSTVVADLDHLWVTSTALSRASRSAQGKVYRRDQLSRGEERTEAIIKVANEQFGAAETASIRKIAKASGVWNGSLMRFAQDRGYHDGSRMPVEARALLTAYAIYLRDEAKKKPAQEVWSVRTTGEIVNTLMTDHGRRHNHAVPCVEPITMPEKRLPLDPYVLGAWLGDGDRYHGKIVSDDAQIVEEIVDAGFPIGHVSGNKGTTAKNYRFEGLVPALRAAGFPQLSRVETPSRQNRIIPVSKRIPTRYLRASYEQRLALLQGIMDTDGTISPTGLASIDLCDERLATDVLELIRTLGIRVSIRKAAATITERDESGNRVQRITGTRWRMNFTTALPIFRLKRKLDRVPVSDASNGRHRELRYITNAKSVPPRTVRCIAVDSANHVFLAGDGFVPTHNSLSHMSCAALAAQALHERTVISTDSLALQSQFIDKDLPVVAQALTELTGFELQYAVLKGIGNYVDPVSVMVLAQGLTGLPGLKHFPGLIEALDGPLDSSFRPDGWGTFSDPGTLAELARWGLEAYIDDNAAGDRDSCPVEHTTDDWQLINATSDTKAKEQDTGYLPKADLAKELAAEAHILITNHTLLGMQAATGMPIVFGSKRLGRFHNIIVDEAHTLPAQVRARGANEVSERAIRSTLRAVAKVVESKYLEEDAESAAGTLNDTLRDAISGLEKREDALRVHADDEGPIAQVADQIFNFIAGATGDVQRAQKLTDDLGMRQNCRRALGALERLSSAVDAAITPGPQVARWVSKGDDKFPPKFESSPVDVSGLIYGRLWNTDPMLSEEELAQQLKEQGIDPDDDGETASQNVTVPMGVACVSATLPTAFHAQVALGSPTGEYESPFGEAYAGSAAFVPRCNSDRDIAALESKFSRGDKKSFDTYRHDSWCVPQIIDLVEANGGSALVLAAKSSSGKKYADELRRSLPGIKIYSQWDGGQTSRIVDMWRHDETSVLVGTKSLMTGVDVSGDSNSLVIIDRPPRAAKNVIDEARAEGLINNGYDRWVADRLVYVADAAMLLEQALGRLIRRTSDRGMVAILDPRLLNAPDTVYAYQTQTQQMFVRPLVQFGSRFKDRQEAMNWLRERRTA